MLARNGIQRERPMELLSILQRDGLRVNISSSNRYHSFVIGFIRFDIGHSGFGKFNGDLDSGLIKNYAKCDQLFYI